jgi:hypothetical protein
MRSIDGVHGHISRSSNKYCDLLKVGAGGRIAASKRFGPGRSIGHSHGAIAA